MSQSQISWFVPNKKEKRKSLTNKGFSNVCLHCVNFDEISGKGKDSHNLDYLTTIITGNLLKGVNFVKKESIHSSTNSKHVPCAVVSSVKHIQQNPLTSVKERNFYCYFTTVLWLCLIRGENGAERGKFKIRKERLFIQ